MFAFLQMLKGNTTKDIFFLLERCETSDKKTKQKNIGLLEKKLYVIEKIFKK